jgi:hypothetical protein
MSKGAFKRNKKWSQQEEVTEQRTPNGWEER